MLGIGIVILYRECVGEEGHSGQFRKKTNIIFLKENNFLHVLHVLVVSVAAVVFSPISVFKSSKFNK